MSFTNFFRYSIKRFSFIQLSNSLLVDGMFLFKNCCTLLHILSLFIFINQYLGINRQFVVVSATTRLLSKYSPTLKMAPSLSSHTLMKWVSISCSFFLVKHGPNFNDGYLWGSGLETARFWPDFFAFFLNEAMLHCSSPHTTKRYFLNPETYWGTTWRCSITLQVPLMIR